MGCGASLKSQEGPVGVGIVPAEAQAPSAPSKSSSAVKANSAKDQKKPATSANEEPENEPLVYGSEEPLSPSESKNFSRKENQTKKVKGSGSRSRSKEASLPQTGDVGPENRKFLSKVLQKHFLFAGLESDERNSVIAYMTSQKVADGEVIFTQGQTGDCCYIIQSGTFIVSIDAQDLKQLKSKHTFGELAMLYNVNRTATVSCKEAGVLWKMPSDCFRDCMDMLSNKHIATALGFLDSDPNFCNMKPDDRKKLAGACTVLVFGRNEQILREGEVGDWMFIVIEGNVQTTDQHGNTVVKKPGTILGSAGLMYTRQQVSGAKAIDNVMCLALGKSQLDRLIGPVEEVLRQSAIKALLVDNIHKSMDLSFFKQLGDDQQSAIIRKFEEVSFSEGEVVISQGSRAQLVIVIEGEVAILPVGQSEAGQSATSARAIAAELLTSGMTFGGKPLLENLPCFTT